jgi:hypothetical protein
MQSCQLYDRYMDEMRRPLRTYSYSTRTEEYGKQVFEQLIETTYIQKKKGFLSFKPEI